MARDFAGQLGLQPEFVRIPGGYNELVDAVRESVPQGCRP